MEDGRVDPHATRVSPATLDGSGVGRYGQAACKARALVADIYNTRKKKSLANVFWPVDVDSRPGAGLYSLQDVKQVGIFFSSVQKSPCTHQSLATKNKAR